MGFGKHTRVMDICMLLVTCVSFLVRECLGIVRRGHVVVLEGMLVLVPARVPAEVLVVVSFFLTFICSSISKLKMLH